jgi:hypothetical protein
VLGQRDRDTEPVGTTPPPGPPHCSEHRRKAAHSRQALLHCKKKVSGCYTVKRLAVFLSPATNQTLPGGEQFNYSLPWRVWLVASRLGAGKQQNLFYSVEKKGNLDRIDCKCFFMTATIVAVPHYRNDMILMILKPIPSFQ